jgi:flagellar hook-associated protein 3 FlgL
MRVSSSTFTGGFIGEIQQLEQQQNTLQEQASSGLSVTLPSDNPSVMSEVLNLQTNGAANTQYQSNITQLQASATTSATAMNSLQTIVSQVNEIATNASSGTASSTQLSTYASEVEACIQQAMQLGNTQDANGNYIFGGTDSSTKPFVATTDANGNVTGVSYKGNTNVNQNDIGLSMTVATQVPGENTTGSGAEGLFADSRTGADLFKDMVSLQQNLASGDTSAISSTNAPALTNDENNIINQISANGVVQSALTAANTMATSQNTNMTTEITNDTSANMAQTMTELDQTQTAYQAALESGTMVMSVSLLNYLQ